MFRGQRDEYGMHAVIGTRSCALALSRLRGRGESGTGVWTRRSIMWENLTVL